MDNTDLLNEKENIDTDNKYALYEEAGLLNSGVDEDGDIQWLGTRHQWDKLECLLRHKLEYTLEENKRLQEKLDNL